MVTSAIKNINLVTVPNGLLKLPNQTLPRIKFAELVKNPKMNTTKPNYIYILIEPSLSLNVSL